MQQYILPIARSQQANFTTGFNLLPVASKNSLLISNSTWNLYAALKAHPRLVFLKFHPGATNSCSNDMALKQGSKSNPTEGHIGILFSEGWVAKSTKTFLASTSRKQNAKVSRRQNLPAEEIELYKNFILHSYQILSLETLGNSA
ncbi:hypothetical protein EVAR_72734_1 [Eumeta japonica]|uniref:Uncharacterized protein n=1 Tax=Eumeta variegata TaxID=151549 RepID=A0A4C1TRD3_EUMVA|nr:hypothetical protein EVAR_72734_1 [Eumeta japonica]